VGVNSAPLRDSLAVSQWSTEQGEWWQSPRTFKDEFEARMIDLDNVRVGYTDWRPQTDETLLLIHGFRVQGHTWDPIASVLSKQYRVVVPDLRGHGESSWSGDGYWTPQFVEDLIGLLTKLNIQKCHVVGHSLGGRIGLALAAADPNRVLSLVVSDCGPELPVAAARQSEQRARSRSVPRGFKTRSEAVEAYREEFPDWKPIFHHLHAEYQLRKNWAGVLVEKADPELYWLTRAAGRSEEPYLWAAAGKIKCPVLVLWGRTSQYVDAELIGRMAEVIADFRAVSYACGHYVPRERPVEFSSEVLQFVGATRGLSG
jgi:pimeloyl-ACP methyl ester carboxylesterase